MAEGFKLASAYVEVDPDLSSFEEKLQAKLEEMSTALQVPVMLDPQDIAASIQRIHDQVEEEGGARIAAVLDPQDIAASAERAREMVEEEGPAKIPAELDLSRLESSLEEGRLEAESVPVRIPVEANMQFFVDKLLEDLSTVEGLSVKVTVLPDMTTFHDELAQDLFLARAVATLPVRVHVGNQAGFLLEVEALVATAAENTAAEIEVRPTISPADATHAIESAIQDMEDAAGERGINVPVTMDPNSVRKSADKAADQIQQALESGIDLQGVIEQQLSEGLAEGVNEALNDLPSKTNNVQLPLNIDDKAVNDGIKKLEDEANGGVMRIPVEPQIDVQSWLNDVNSRIETIWNTMNKLPVEADTTEFEHQIDKAVDDIRGNISSTFEHDITEEMASGITTELEQLQGRLDDFMKNAGASVPRDIQASYDAIFRTIADESANAPELHIKASNPIDDAWRADVKQALKSISNDIISIPVDSDTAPFIDHTSAEVKRLADKAATVPVDADMTRFRAELGDEINALGSAVSIRLKEELDQESADNVDKQVKSKAQDTGQQAGGMMGLLIGTALMGAGPLIAGAFGTVAELGMAALTFKIQSGNEQLHNSWMQLANDAKSTISVATEEMVPGLTAAFGVLDNVINDQRPVINSLFANANQDTVIFADGIAALANNALPGLNDAFAHSEPLAQGMAAFLRDIGVSIDDVAESVAHDSGAMGAELGQFGGMVEKLFGDLSGMLPGLGLGFSGLTNTVSAALTVIKPMAPVLGVIAGNALPVYTTFKLMSMLTPGIQSFGKSVMDVGTQIQGAGYDKFGATVSGAGKAIGAASSALPILGAGIALVSTLVADSQQKFQNWQAGLLQSADSAGQAMDQFQHSVAWMPGAWQQLTAGLSQVQLAQVNYNLAVSKYGASSSQAATAARDLGSAQATANAQTNDMHQAMGTLSAQMDITTSGTHVLATGLQDASNQASNLTTYLTAVQTHLAEMADHGLEQADDATSAFYQALQQMTTSVQSATGPILDMNGGLDLTSQRGQAVLTALEGARNQMAQYAGAMQNANQPQSAINAGLNTMENNLITTLEKMGMNATEAHNLASAYMAVPTDIETNVNLVTQPAQNAIDRFVTQNNGRQITVFVNTQTGSVRAAGSTVSAQAQGSIVMPMAAGGVAQAAPIAQVVPPNTPRLIGDNPTVPEAYIPLDPNSQRSRQILADSMAVMGVQPSINNHNTFNISSTQPWAVSQQIMADQQWLAFSARAT